MSLKPNYLGPTNIALGDPIELKFYADSTTPQYAILYISGSRDGNLTMGLADADVIAKSNVALFVSKRAVPSGTYGEAVSWIVRTGDTSAASAAGQPLWLSTTAGQVHTQHDGAPTPKIRVGEVLSVHATTGQFLYAPQFYGRANSRTQKSLWVASNTVTDTITETDFNNTVQHTIEAASLSERAVVEVDACGVVLSSNSTDTLTLKLYFGGVAVFTSAAVNTTTADTWRISAKIAVESYSATGSVWITTIWAIGPNGDATLSARHTATFTGLAPDLTAAALIKVSATWSVAHADNQVTMNGLHVKVHD